MRILFASLILAACSSNQTTPPADSGPPPLTDAEYRDKSVQGMHDALLKDVDALAAATKELQMAAPTTPGRGWDAQQDAAAITAMQAAWTKARTAYEKVEGALAPLFPDIDYDIDARYDDFLTDLGKADANLFDDQGVTGMHGVERIIYLKTTPQRVIDFEATLVGYTPAAYPANEMESSDFKNKLCAKLVADTALLQKEWTPAKINAAVAFQGIISLMNEQREKVNKASSNEEESRYAQHTMTDLRDNLVGTKNAYPQFRDWIVSKKSMDPTKDGPTIDMKIQAGFAKLDVAYAAVSGEGIPVPPPTWSAENPTPQDLMTPFGQLYTAVRTAVDPAAPESIVSQMNNAATILGFPQFMK